MTDTLLTPFGQHQDDLLARIEKLESNSTIVNGSRVLQRIDRLEARVDKAEGRLEKFKQSEPAWAQQYREAIERIPDERVDDLFKIILTWEQHGKITHINTETIKSIFEAYKRAGK